MAEKKRINIKPMIGALAVSIVVWFMVATEKIYSHQIRVPIEIVRLAEGKTLLDPIPEYATIEVQGKGRSLIGIWFYDVRFKLEFPNVKRFYSIDLKNYLTFLDLPATFSLSVLEIIEPEPFDLRVDNLISKKLPVVYSGNIQTEDGYLFVGVKFNPDSVDISGPESKLNQINAIQTEKIDFSGKKTSFAQKVQLHNQETNIFTITPKLVNVDFDIQRLVELIIYEIPVRVINVPDHLEVTPIPSKLSLKIKGGEKIVASLSADQINAEIAYGNQYRPDPKKYAVSISTPKNIEWIESIPKTFTLQVKRK